MRRDDDGVVVITTSRRRHVNRRANRRRYNPRCSVCGRVGRGGISRSWRSIGRSRRCINRSRRYIDRSWRCIDYRGRLINNARHADDDATKEGGPITVITMPPISVVAVSVSISVTVSISSMTPASARTIPHPDRYSAPAHADSNCDMRAAAVCLGDARNCSED
jgi:hypothetical protein